MQGVRLWPDGLLEAPMQSPAVDENPRRALHEMYIYIYMYNYVYTYTYTHVSVCIYICIPRDRLVMNEAWPWLTCCLMLCLSGKSRLAGGSGTSKVPAPVVMT